MHEDVFALWVYLARSPLLWLTVTILAYCLCDRIAAALRRAPLANPVLMSMCLVGLLVRGTGTPYADIFRRRAVHPLPARAGDRGAGDSALSAPPDGGPVHPADGLRADRRFGDRAGLGGADRPAAGRTRRCCHLDRAQIGDRRGGDGHFRAARRRSGADGGAGDPDRHPGRHHRHAVDGRGCESPTSARGASPPASPRTASAPRARFRSIRSRAPSPASRWA